MSTTIKPISQTLSLSNLTLTSLHTTLIPRALAPYFSIPSKPFKLHLSRFLPSPQFPHLFIQRKPFSSVVSYVAAQGEHGDASTALQEIGDEVGEEELQWGGQGLDGPQAGLSNWEASEGDGGVMGGGEGEEGGEDDYLEPPEDAVLFVGNLPYDVDSDKLAQIFEPAGIVEIAEVIYNRQTNQSRGFGFVTMRTVEEAEKAAEMFNRYELNGRLLTVNKAAPKGTPVPRPPRTRAQTFGVYVGNLPWDLDKDRLKEVFSVHGEVVDAFVVYNRETGRSRGFGFVNFASESDRDAAIVATDGQTVDGRVLKVKVALDRPQRTF